MAYPFYTLLAAGYPGAGAVPHFLDAHTPVPDTWYSSGWSFWFTKRHHHIARQIAAAVVIFYQGLFLYKPCFAFLKFFSPAAWLRLVLSGY